MPEALGDHVHSVSIGGRLIINFSLADDILVNAEEKEEAFVVLVDSHDKVQNGDWSRQDISDDKQPKMASKERSR